MTPIRFRDNSRATVSTLSRVMVSTAAWLASAGQTQFRLRQAGLTFHSEAYDVLIVSGAEARFGGSGRVEGDGGYSFRASVVDGDARVDGNVVLGSSRTLKTAFDAVEPAEVLAKLTDLPIASWRYKTEDESTRRIGPFAEDFQRLFGLGDGATISMVDAQGVAFAAIQGLAQRLAEKEDELANLRSEKDVQIIELLARLTTVEQRLDAGPPSNGGRSSGGLR